MSNEGPSESKRQMLMNNSDMRKKGMKRKHQPVFDGESRSPSNVHNGANCPICLHPIQSAYMTECGHSFCHACILACLEKQNVCPSCNATINADKLFPNFALNTLVQQQQSKYTDGVSKILSNTDSNVRELIDNVNSSAKVSLEDMTTIIDLLQQKKQFLLLESQMGHARLTLEFLNQIKETKEEKMKEIQRELSVISKDIDLVTHKSETLEQQIGNQLVLPHTNGVTPSSKKDYVNATIRQRFSEHKPFLHDFYFSMRQQAILNSDDEVDSEGLDKFTDALSKFVKYKQFRQLATLNYTSDMYSLYSIVSSIEFDKDADYFAIAGVTKKIKVYDYKQVVTDVVDMHYPITEMSCASKISCIAWNPYLKNELVSSDYEGTVSMWDPFTGKKTQIFQEHEKRCWCVDYNRMDPQLLASGSDDSKVKIWSNKTQRSILNISAEANVCCVKFNPKSRYHLAFGAADHCVHYYDLRFPNKELMTFKGHQKAVSYAKFLNGEELVSASTDSQLKLWNVNSGSSVVRTFKGHINEKNFVGLACDSDFIACGSEDNSLCVYYKGLSNILHKHKFDVVRCAWQQEAAREEDSNEFVSAVSWMPDSSVIVVANSQGIVKVLELI